MEGVLSLGFQLALLALLTGLLLLTKQRRAAGLPPGPPKLPVVGNLLQLVGKQPHLVVTELSRKYGPLMSLQLGAVPAVVASSPEMARELLQTHDLVFSSRPILSNAKLLTYGQSGLMWSPYGRDWRDIRKFCVLELFTAKRVALFQDVRVQEVFNLVRGVFQASQRGGDASVDLKQKLSEFAWTLTARMVASNHEIVDIHQGIRAKSLIDKGMALAGAFNLSDYITGLSYLDVQGYKARTNRVRQQLDELFQDMIDKHRLRARSSDAPPEDFIGILLSAEGMNDDKIKATIQDIFAAGTDTTAGATEWALTELIRHPRVFFEIRKEMDKVVGCERLIQESDVPKLSYLQAIVKETLRLHPPGPLLQHHSTQDCKVQGYHIPAGTRAFINLYAISRDPLVWEKPLKFEPERFLRQPGIDMSGQHFQLIPFGSGRRICPGMALGLKTVHLALAQLLHCFDWELPAGEVADDTEVCRMTLPKANPLVLVPTPRLAAHLYS